MLTQEDDVEIHALARRGWSVSAIARHTGRDPKTVRKYLAVPTAVREPAPSCLEPFRAYLEARFEDDVHVLQEMVRHHLLLAHHKPPPRHAVHRHAGFRRDVTRPDVFFERALHAVSNIRMREIDHAENPLSAFRTFWSCAS